MPSAGAPTSAPSKPTESGSKGKPPLPPGEAGQVVANFLDKLQIATMDLEQIKDWTANEVQEFAEMFMINTKEIEVCCAPFTSCQCHLTPKPADHLAMASGEQGAFLMPELSTPLHGRCSTLTLASLAQHPHIIVEKKEPTHTRAGRNVANEYVRLQHGRTRMTASSGDPIPHGK